MKHIVVIGAGPGGIAFAQSLGKTLSDSEADITLLEKQNFHFHAFGSLRGMTDKSYIPKLFVPLNNIQGNVKIKCGANVTSVDYDSRTVSYTILSPPTASSPPHERMELNHTSVLEESIPYDYLVIATGSSYSSPIKPSETDSNKLQKLLLQTTENIEKANSILIIGGGAVGIEMAGELKSFYPNKKIMLMDGNTQLLANQNVPRLRVAAKKALENLGVELFLGHRLSDASGHMSSHEFETKSVITDHGLTIKSDARILCIGMRPNVALMKDQECLDGKFIKVKNTMEVDHPDDKYNGVFVLGDASNHPTPKMGYWAMQQGKHLAKAVAASLRRGKAFTAFSGPSESGEPLLLSLGPEGGLTNLPLFGGIVLGNFFTKRMKSKDLMAGMTWKNLNTKMP